MNDYLSNRMKTRSCYLLWYWNTGTDNNRENHTSESVGKEVVHFLGFPLASTPQLPPEFHTNCDKRKPVARSLYKTTNKKGKTYLLFIGR